MTEQIPSPLAAVLSEEILRVQSQAVALERKLKRSTNHADSERLLELNRKIDTLTKGADAVVK